MATTKKNKAIQNKYSIISWSNVIFADPNPWPCSRWLAIHGSSLSLNKPLDTVVMFAPGTVEHCCCSSLSIHKTDCYICYTLLHIFLFHSKTEVLTVLVFNGIHSPLTIAPTGGTSWTDSATVWVLWIASAPAHLDSPWINEQGPSCPACTKQRTPFQHLPAFTSRYLSDNSHEKCHEKKELLWVALRQSKVTKCGLCTLKTKWAVGSPPWEEQGRTWSEHQGVLPSEGLHKKQLEQKKIRNPDLLLGKNDYKSILFKSPCHALHYKSKSKTSVGSSSSDLRH